MVKRGPLLRPQASEGEAQHGPFCWIVENLPDLAVLVEPLLLVRRVLREQFSILHGTGSEPARCGRRPAAGWRDFLGSTRLCQLNVDDRISDPVSDGDREAKNRRRVWRLQLG